MSVNSDNPRLRKLRALVDKHGGHRELCRVFPDLNADYIGQLLKGTRNFGERAARKMAEQIGQPADYFEQAGDLTEGQQILLAIAEDLSNKQLGQLIQVAGWIREGRQVVARDPPAAARIDSAKGA